MAQAHVIALGLKEYLNNGIRSWFRHFNSLPPIPLTAGKVDIVTGQPTFEHLLELIIASPYLNFILIAHGHEDGSGLYLHMTRNSGSVRAEYHYLRRLLQFDAGDKFTAVDQQRLGMNAGDVARLRGLMQKVQAKRVHCIEFRACNLGRSAASLDVFRRFFGARRLGAPDLHSFFGLGPVVTGQKMLDTHAQGHRGGTWETYKFPFAMRDSADLVCCFGLDEHNKPAAGHVAADTEATLDGWIKQYLMEKAARPPGDHMPIHGLWNVGRQIILDPEDISQPLGGWGGPIPKRLILPTSVNYSKHIIYST